MKELEQLKFLNLKIQEATSKSVAITEKLVTTNKTMFCITIEHKNS